METTALMALPVVYLIIGIQREVIPLFDAKYVKQYQNEIRTHFADASLLDKCTVMFIAVGLSLLVGVGKAIFWPLMIGGRKS